MKTAVKKKPVASPALVKHGVSRVVFSFVACPESSMIASTRLARFVREQLSKTSGNASYETPLVWDASIGEQKPDVLVIVNGAYAYCKHLAELSRAILAARRIVWIQNDYTIIPPKHDGDAASPFRRAFVQREEEGRPRMDFWTTCEKWASATKASALINWNALAYSDTPVDRSDVHPNLLYYGSFREGSGKSTRVPYFDRYFAKPLWDTVISSPSKKFDKYVGPKLSVIRPFEGSLLSGIASYGAGLYLEDRKSHEEYHSPPNRFYEMLSAGLPMLFQPECGGTLRRGGYDPQQFEVKNPLEISRRMEKREEIGAEQRKRWRDSAKEESRKLHLDAVPLAWNRLTETMS